MDANKFCGLLNSGAFTFLCKSSRGLESQKPVRAMAAGDKIPASSRCSYLHGVGGGLEPRGERCGPRPGAHKARGAGEGGATGSQSGQVTATISGPKH